MVIVQLPTKAVIQALVCSVDMPHSTIPEVLGIKASDYRFPALVQDIRLRGQLAPICITKLGGAGSYFSGTVDRGWELGQGHHRTRAAVYLGLPYLLVDLNGYWDNYGRAQEYKLDVKEWDSREQQSHAAAVVEERAREWRRERMDEIARCAIIR
jgi:hypothetical protein